MSEWISIKSKMPEEGKTVLVYASRGDIKRGGMVYRAKHINGVWYAENGENYNRYRITHWQPIEEKENE